MRLAVLLATFTLAHYTVPRYQALADTLCEAGPTQETMGHVEIWWWPQGGRPALWRTKNVAGLEGRQDTLQLPVTTGLCRLSAVDAAGNRACNDELLWVPFNEPGTVGIPADPGTLAGPQVLYDLAGRRVQRPLKSGLYFEKTAKGERLVVIK